MLNWIPIGNQKSLFGDMIPEPLYNDIVIAKLVPKQVF